MARPSQVRTYDPTTSVVFLRTSELFGGLSNMAPGFPLHVGGMQIRTSEALYQACRFPHLPDVQRQIIAEQSPMTAKMRSKPYREHSRSDWDQVRVQIMRWCLRVKLAQNQDTFGHLLLSSGARAIVERSSKDGFWGALVERDGTLVGANVLGRLLMELREQLRTDGFQAFQFVEPLSIVNFCLDQKPIETVWALAPHHDANLVKAHLTQHAPSSLPDDPVQPTLFQYDDPQYAAAARTGKPKRTRLR